MEPSAAGSGMLQAVPLGALVLLIGNDHWLKHAHPGWLSGKLSDIAGMMYFPILLQALFEIGLRVGGKYRGPSQRVLIVAVIATGVSFSMIKTIPWAGTAYRVALGSLQWPGRVVIARLRHHPMPSWQPVRLTADGSDLVALPFLVVPWRWGRQRG